MDETTESPTLVSLESATPARNFRFRRYVGLGIVLALVAGYIFYTHTFGWVTYTAAVEGFKLQHPKSWRVVKEDHPEVYYFMDTEGALAGTGGRLMLSVALEKADSLAAWLSTQADGIAGNDTTIDDLPAKELNIGAKGPCEKDWATFANGTLYRIHRFPGTCNDNSEIEGVLESLSTKK